MRPVFRAVLAIVSFFVAITFNHPPSQHMASTFIKRSIPPSLTRFFPKQPLQAPFIAHSKSASPQPVFTRTFNVSIPTMAAPSSAVPFLDAVKYRHSIYPLAHESPISDDRIQEIVEETLHNVPSSFNSQSTRLVLVLNEAHTKLWDMIREVYRQQLPAEKFEQANQKFGMFQNAYGTVLCYEDTTTVREFQEKFKTYQDRFPGCMSLHPRTLGTPSFG